MAGWQRLDIQMYIFLFLLHKLQMLIDSFEIRRRGWYMSANDSFSMTILPQWPQSMSRCFHIG
jgi:hypothetical protein